MRISLNFLLTVFFIFSAVTARSSIIAPSSGCDTLITKMGQVVVVQILPGSDDQTIRFVYCGDKVDDKTYKIARSNIAEIRKSAAPVKTQISQQQPDTVKVVENIPAGSVPVEPAVAAPPHEIPKESKPLTPEPEASSQSISLFAKMAAIGGFGSMYLILFAIAFNPIALIMVLPLSIMGLVFSAMVLKRTKKRKAEFLKQRRLAKWSLAMAISWLGFAVLYILLLILFLFIFFI